LTPSHQQQQHHAQHSCSTHPTEQGPPWPNACCPSCQRCPAVSPSRPAVVSSLASTPWSSGRECVACAVLAAPARTLNSKCIPLAVQAHVLNSNSRSADHRQPKCAPMAVLAFHSWLPVNQFSSYCTTAKTHAHVLLTRSHKSSWPAVHSSDSIAIFKKLCIFDRSLRYECSLAVLVQVYYEKRLKSFTTRAD
jgi:hypothetical protein